MKFIPLLCMGLWIIHTARSQYTQTSTFESFISTVSNSTCYTTQGADYCPSTTSDIDCSAGPNELSPLVTVTGADFGLAPSGYVVTNVVLSVKRLCPYGSVKFARLGLVSASVQYEVSSPSFAFWSNSLTTENFTSFEGKSSWDPMEFQSTSFGVYWQSNHTTGSVGVIFCVQVTVTYTDSHLASPSSSPSTGSTVTSPSSSPSPSQSSSPSNSPSPSAGSVVSFSPSSGIGGHSKKKSNSNNIGIIVGVVVGVVVLAGVILGVIFLRRRNQTHQQTDQSLELHNNSNNVSTSNGNTDVTNYQPLTSSFIAEDTNNDNRKASVMKRESELDYHIKYSELIMEKEVGRGAFGAVWKGKWRSNPVAVKKMLVEHMNDKQMENFVQEMSLMKALRPSPNVVLLLGVCDEPLCVVTEFCEAGSLHSLLRSNTPMDWSLQKKIVTGIAKGMLHLHLEGIVHRDLAARNVLLTSNMEPKISDFGLSRFVTGEQDSAKTTSNVGPLKWMAPECIRDREYSKASDVWAYGITLIEIFTRDDPYGRMDGLSVATRVAIGELKPTIPDNVPDRLAKIMEAFFAYKAMGRPDFQSICDDLESM